MADSTKTLKIYENSVEVQFLPPIRLLDLLNATNVSINQSCGGFGTCTTCRFIVRQGPSSFTARTETEMERAEERGFADNERLACQTEILDHAEIEIPKDPI